jgi:general secretion pathway protein N
MIEASIANARAALSVDDLSGRLSLGTALAPLPIPVVELDNVTARFGRGECLHAQGRVRASLGAAIGGLALPSGLSGEARCDGGMLLLPLAGQSGMEALDLRIGADGRYRATFRVRPSDDAARDRLVAAGFQLGEGGYLLAVDGTF